MRLHIPFTLALALLPGGLSAQDRLTGDVRVRDSDGLTIATCTSGQGCRCFASSHSLETLKTQIVTDPPEGVANPVLVRLDGELFWSAQSSHAVDLVFGGDGLCDPEIFDESDTGLPLDGMWELTVTGHELSGCPQEVASAMAGEVVVGQSNSRQFTWPRPFSPAPLTSDIPGSGSWVQRSGGTWFNEIMNEGNGAARMTMQARIISPREIATTSVFSTSILHMSNCVSTTHATVRLRG